jgi:L-fucose mutarotase/ribose pyranase (RbsD/FucU family)
MRFGAANLNRSAVANPRQPKGSEMCKQETLDPTLGWEESLTGLLPLFGHRNWIVVADSAYPAQSCAGITTCVAGSDHIAVLRTALRSIDAQSHVRAKIYTDAELEFVPESDAPGISDLRNQLQECLRGHQSYKLPHDEIIARLDESARIFQVLIIKSNLTIPYTSVFIELDCGYWSADSEERIRTIMGRSSQDFNPSRHVGNSRS